MINFRNPYYIVPPGSKKQILYHPMKENGVVELAFFEEHRYAFFYWLQWKRKINPESPPCLVSLDWHQDLCYPCDTEKEWLSKLDQTNDGDVALFCWAKLAGNNDGHILSAAYLNIIGNIYVHCRQGNFDSDWEDETLLDIYGNKHTIKKFKTPAELEQYLTSTDEIRTYFDIDLDFFTIDNPYNGVGRKYTYMDKKGMVNLLSTQNSVIEWIFHRLVGFTIATEPEHCGGLLRSNKLLDMINRIYFYPDLFTQNCQWRHK